MKKAPTLQTLKEQPVTLEELQAALVMLIELYNETTTKLNRIIQENQRYSI